MESRTRSVSDMAGNWIGSVLAVRKTSICFIGTPLVLAKVRAVSVSPIKEVEDSVRCATISTIISRIRMISQHSHNELPVKSN